MVFINTLAGVAALASILAGTASAQKCINQSCEIANLSGSTGIPFKVATDGKKQASGSNSAGLKCISRYYQYGAGIPPGCENPKVPCNAKPRGSDTPAAAAPPKESSEKERLAKRLELGFHWPHEVSETKYSSRMERVKRKEMVEKAEFQKQELKTEEVAPEVQGEEEGLEKRQSCKAYTLIFARGTGEPGSMGSTVGPSLSSGLGAKWSTQGVSYDASIAGDDCIGLPGGVACMKQLNKVASSCPTTKIIVSGYSQGAMVARNCVAFAEKKARDQVAGVVTFGDPFNGAPVKDFPYEHIKVFCSAADGVCQGQFKITAAHLAYVGAKTSEAVRWMQERVKA